jgi:acetyl esterase/lipase
MRETRLWPEEFEQLRPEAREMATAFSGFLGESVPADAAERLAMMRHLLESIETDSPDGRDAVIGGVACREFRRPEHAGLYLHFHGGAMMVGHPRIQDDAHAEMSKRLGISIISVDYRLAPEHPFPAGADDCLAVAREVLATRAGPLVLGGESAGAYYAALTLLRIRDELRAADRVAGANLAFGIYDLSGTQASSECARARRPMAWTPTRSRTCSPATPRACRASRFDVPTSRRSTRGSTAYPCPVHGRYRRPPAR